VRFAAFGFVRRAPALFFIRRAPPGLFGEAFRFTRRGVRAALRFGRAAVLRFATAAFLRPFFFAIRFVVFRFIGISSSARRPGSSASRQPRNTCPGSAPV
jgi:hypothetical protein